jgi:hypothetical protein
LKAGGVAFQWKQHLGRSSYEFGFLNAEPKPQCWSGLLLITALPASNQIGMHRHLGGIRRSGRIVGDSYKAVKIRNDKSA